MQNSTYSPQEVHAMRRFLIFVTVFAVVVAAGILLPRSRFSTRAVAAASQSNWSTGTCQDSHSGRWGHWGESHLCQLRRTTITLPAGHLSVQSANGDITVIGEDRTDAAIEATVNVWAPSISAAQELLNQIAIDTAGGQIRAHGPHSILFSRGGYSVSYRLRVPRHLAADIQATNGGIRLSHLDGSIQFATTNGGITLDRLSGDVRGHATNGSITINLEGDRWQGTGLDASTVNGGVSLHLPENYSARLQASTVNGGIRLGFPISIQGAIKNHLDASLGSGGPTIHIGTVNGGISISHGAFESGSGD